MPSDSPRPWTRLASDVVVDRWWMRLRVDRIQIPDGPILDEYHVAEYPDWACVLALTDDGDAVLIEQYRYGIDRVLLELPAGAIDSGEEPEAAAQRELLEETGYRAREWRRLGRLAVEPGRHTNYGHLYVALGCHKVAEPDLDATEDLRLCLTPVRTLQRRVEAGDIAHGIHAAAIFWAQAKGWLDEPDASDRV